MSGKRKEEIRRVTAEIAARLEELESVAEALAAALAAEEIPVPETGDELTTGREQRHDP